jgi:hypothetical protein
MTVLLAHEIHSLPKELNLNAGFWGPRKACEFLPLEGYWYLICDFIQLGEIRMAGLLV